MKLILFTAVLFYTMAIVAEERDESLLQQDNILVIASEGKLFEQACNGINSELEKDFVISIIRIGDMTTVVSLDKLFETGYRPRAVVLVGNNAIRMYKRFSGEKKGRIAEIPVVAIMALDVERAVNGIKNVQGIAYETPMMTAIVNARRVLNSSIKKVGVLYRESSRQFIEKNIPYCLKENVEIKGVLVGDDPAKLKSSILNGLNTFAKKERIDAVWIPNDNVILKPDLIANAWLPVIRRYKVPLIVGVESLVNPTLDFGTFAVIPDPEALGEQAAGIITNLMENGWKQSGVIIYPAISMYSVLNLKKAVEVYGKTDLRLDEVNKILDDKKPHYAY